MKEIFYIYKITCTKGRLKNHYYIGQHKTTKMDDGYKGSGVKINKYYKKHPNDYIKEILCFCNDADELNAAEDFYVGDLYETDPLCLNLKAGGNQPGVSDESRQKMSETLSDGRRKGEKHPMYGKHRSEETRQKISDNHADFKGENSPWYGKHHTSESRQKISKTLSDGRLKGEKNGFYGKGYLTTGEKNSFFGKHHTSESRQKMSDAVKGEKHPKAKQCTINGVAYGCLKDAAEAIGMNYSTFKKKYKNNKL